MARDRFSWTDDDLPGVRIKRKKKRERNSSSGDQGRSGGDQSDKPKPPVKPPG